MAKKKKTKKKTAKSLCEEVLCAGFGGQGIMFMGKLLAQAGLIAGSRVTWMPSYGAEVRGGTAYSMTKISSKDIASPIVSRPDILIVMNRPSLDKYGPKLKEAGVLISNKTLIGDVPKRKDTALISIPMTEIAAGLGDTRCANMIAIGALVKRSKALSLKNVVSALKYAFRAKEELFLLNKKALEKGYKLVHSP